MCHAACLEIYFRIILFSFITIYGKLRPYILTLAAGNNFIQIILFTRLLYKAKVINILLQYRPEAFEQISIPRAEGQAKNSRPHFIPHSIEFKLQVSRLVDSDSTIECGTAAE